MSAIYDLKHITRYRYVNPVQFGEHRAIFLSVAGPPTPGCRFTYRGRAGATMTPPVDQLFLKPKT